MGLYKQIPYRTFNLHRDRFSLRGSFIASGSSADTTVGSDVDAEVYVSHSATGNYDILVAGTGSLQFTYASANAVSGDGTYLCEISGVSDADRKVTVVAKTGSHASNAEDFTGQTVFFNIEGIR